VFGSTHTDELIAFINGNAPKQTDIIKELIDKHTPAAHEMLKGHDYYFNETDIQYKRRYFWEDGAKKEDSTKANNKLTHGWHNLLVDQKVAYLTGNPLNISAESDELQEKVNDTLGDEFDDTLSELVLGASNKGKEFLHPYIDEEGKFNYVIIPAEQVIPLYDNSKRKKLLGSIRLYPLDENVTKIEVWDDKQTTFYEMINGQVHLDATVEENPAPHFSAEFAGRGRFGFGWGRVPFVEFKNNEWGKSDLYLYKKLADEYDKTRSQFADDLEDVPEAATVLKGYEGQSAREFNDNLRFYKTIMVSGEPGSGVDKLTVEIPVDAKKEHLDRLSDDIFTFGKGLDTKTDKFGNSPSGVALKFLYGPLDMKCSTLENKFKKALKEFMWFVVEYLNMTEKTSYNVNELSYTFNKSMITNEAEAVTMAKESKGVISDRTIIANHPWVTDIGEEMAELEKQMESYVDLDQVDDDEESE